MESDHTFSVPDSLPLVRDFSSDRPQLLIAVGGGFGGMAIPPFEFFNLAKGLQVRKLFIRDLETCWYHRGLSGLSASIPETVEVLRRMIAESRAEQVVMVGNSMGAYAAILFGALLNVQRVEAISPQTTVSPRHLFRFRDFRWLRWTLRMYARAARVPRFFDLRPVLASARYDTQIHLRYGLDEGIEIAHANHLAGLEGVALHPYPEADHQLIKHLRKTGELRTILSHSFDSNSI